MKNKKLNPRIKKLQEVKRKLYKREQIYRCQKTFLDEQFEFEAECERKNKVNKEAQLLRDREDLFKSPELKASAFNIMKFKNPVGELLDGIRCALDDMKRY